MEPTQYIPSQALSTTTGAGLGFGDITLTSISEVQKRFLREDIDTLYARANTTFSIGATFPEVLTTFTSIGVFIVESTTTLENGQTTVIPVVTSGVKVVRTVMRTTESIVSQTRLTNPMSSVNSSGNKTKAIVGGVIGATVILVLGLIVFGILIRKRRSKAIRSASAHEVSTSSDILGQRVPQAAQISTTSQPFLDFPAMMENRSPSKGIITDRARGLLTQNKQGDTEQAINPFKDPVATEESLSDNDDGGQRVTDALDSHQVMTSQFEGELQQLCALAQSGQLSTEDRLKLEEIRRTTGLTILFDSRSDQFSIGRNTSSGSSSSLAPPSYHTHGS